MNVSDEVVLNGSPKGLSTDELSDNLAKLHRANDSCKHPAQMNQEAYIHPGQEELSQADQPHQVIMSPSTKGVIRLPTKTHINTNQAALDQSQDVTQFCPLCEYTSYVTKDPSMLEACMKQITFHMKYTHDASESGGEESSTTVPKPDKSYREYQEATKQRKVKKVMDDASRNLCEARYFAVPLDNKVLAQNMPITTSPVNTVVDFSHLGVDVSSKETIRKVHNRATTSLRLKDFSDTNLKNFTEAGDEMVAVQYTKDQLQLGKKKKALDSPQECVKAIYNYAAMHGQFHPLDWSPKALLKVVLDKTLENPPVTEQYILLFEKFVSVNAGRAQKNGIPLTYMEIVNLWNTFIAPSPISSVAMERVMDAKFKQYMNDNTSTPKHKNPPANSSLNKKPRLTKDDFCQDWNTSKSHPLCPNTRVEGGCMAGGKFLKHACSKKQLGGRRCNSDGHGYHLH